MKCWGKVNFLIVKKKCSKLNKLWGWDEHYWNLLSKIENVHQLSAEIHHHAVKKSQTQNDCFHSQFSNTTPPDFIINLPMNYCFFFLIRKQWVLVVTWRKIRRRLISYSRRHWLRCIVTRTEQTEQQIVKQILKHFIINFFPLFSKIKGEADFKWMITWDINEKIRPYCERRWKSLICGSRDTKNCFFFLGRAFEEYTWLNSIAKGFWASFMGN